MKSLPDRPIWTHLTQGTPVAQIQRRSSEKGNSRGCDVKNSKIGCIETSGILRRFEEAGRGIKRREELTGRWERREWVMFLSSHPSLSPYYCYCYYCYPYEYYFLSSFLSFSLFPLLPTVCTDRRKSLNATLERYYRFGFTTS